MKTLEQTILQVLENHDGTCLDDEAERQQLALDLLNMFGLWQDEHEHDWVMQITGEEEPMEACSLCPAIRSSQ